MTAEENNYREEWISDPHKLKANRFQPMPNQDAEKFAAFKADIAERGIRYPVYVDEDYNIINGHQRHRAWAELAEAGVDIAPVKVIVEPADAETALTNAYKDNLLQRAISSDELDRMIVQYIKDRQSWWEWHGYVGERKIDGKNHKNYDWSKEGVISDGNTAVAEVFGINEKRIAKLRSRAEADGKLEPAVVFVGKGGAYLRHQRENAAKKNWHGNSDLPDAGGEVEVFTFPLPGGGGELTATSRDELQDKIAKHIREQGDRYKAAVEERDLIASEIREEEESKFKEELEKLRAEAEEDKNQTKEEWIQKNADLLAKYKVEPDQTMLNMFSDADPEALLDALDTSKKQRKYDVLTFANTVSGTGIKVGNLLRGKNYTGEEAAHAVMWEDTGINSYVETFMVLRDWVDEFLRTIEETRSGPTLLKAVNDPEGKE